MFVRPYASVDDMPVFLNVRYMSQPQTGVRRYTEEMASPLGRLRLPYESSAPIVLTPQQPQPTARLGALRVRPISKLRGSPGEQLELPRHTDDGALLNLGHTAPLFGHRQAVVIHDAAVFEHPAAYRGKFQKCYKALQHMLELTRTQILTISGSGRSDLARHLDLAAIRSRSPATRPSTPFALIRIYRCLSVISCRRTGMS